MEKKKERKNYSAPNCVIVQVNETTNLMEASFTGQHNPAHHAVGPAGAKAATIWQEDEEEGEEQNIPSWEY